jgi:hypothetical protein
LWNAFIFKNHHIEDCPSVPPGGEKERGGGGDGRILKSERLIDI